MNLIELFLSQWKPDTTVRELIKMIRQGDLDIERNLESLLEEQEDTVE